MGRGGSMHITYRHGGHHCNDPGKYMPADKVDYYKTHDPLLLAEAAIKREKAGTDESLTAIRNEIDREMEEAVEFASTSPEPSVEENGLTLRIYTSEGSIHWKQEEPNTLSVYRYNEPRQVLTRAQGYLDDAAQRINRFPPGHPEGFLESFANVYAGIIEAVRAHIDGKPMNVDDYAFPTVYDGLREVRFINAAVDSCENGSVWMEV